MNLLTKPRSPLNPRQQTWAYKSGRRQKTVLYQWRRNQWLAALVFFLLLAATCSTIGNGFVGLDDELYIRDKPSAAGLTGFSIAFAFTSVKDLYWHPLAWLSHGLDIELFGQNAAGHHATSVLLHAITAALLCLLLTRLGAAPFPAAAGSLLWALHPLRVESFAWVAERKDVLCALFFVATALLYLRFIDGPSRRRYAGWLCCGALALMSKPTAVSLPVVLFLLDYWPKRRSAKLTRLVIEKLPLAAMSAVVLYLTVLGQVSSGSTSHLANVRLGVRLANAAIAYTRYLGKMLWPVNLACFYPYNPSPSALMVILAALLLCAITVLAVWQHKRPWLLVGWLWFLIVLLPNIGLIQAGRQSIADRFTQIPMIGIVIAIVWTVSEWSRNHPHWRRATVGATCGILVVLAFLTVRQISYWHDSETLFTHALGVEDNDYIRDNLAQAYMLQGRYADAEPHLRAAILLAPNRFEHHNNLANVLLRTGKMDEADHEANAALALAPDNRSVANTMGVVLLRQGSYAKAMTQFDRAIQLGTDPLRVAPALNDAGASLASRGQPQEAEPLIRRAVALNPALVQARRNLILVLLDQGRAAEAKASLDDAVRATGRRQEYRDLAAQVSGQ
jgi:Tfp pilus assembly protein PilF